MVIIVKYSPWNNKGASCALSFAKAACTRGHKVQVFFYGDGVFNIQNAAWLELKKQYNIALNLCSAAINIRDINKKTIPKYFTLTGIAALLQATHNNKVITFG